MLAKVSVALALSNFWVSCDFFAGGPGIAANRWPERPGFPSAHALAHPLWRIHILQFLVHGSHNSGVRIRAELVSQDGLAAPFTL